MSALSIRSVLTSPSGKSMPILGLGTFMNSGNDLELALDAALEAGYRLIDTAYHYGNEAVIGSVLARWFASGKLSRQDIFITTKLPLFANNKDLVKPYLRKQLEALQLTYVDLYLIHNPVGLMPEDASGLDWSNIKLDMNTDHVAVWKAMEKQVDDGLTKGIGLSNFNIKQIERILKVARIKPINLQIEWYLYLQCKAEQAFCRDNGITLTSYSTLGSPGAPYPLFSGIKDNPMVDPVVEKIAKNHKKTPGQVLLRHCLQLGIAVIPKSSKPERVKENAQVFDFTLSKSEMEQLNALDRGEKGRRFIIDVFKSHPEFPHHV